MNSRADPLMTVHLLTSSGHSLLLQQTLDRLLTWICPDSRLFLVSERVTPLRYYERHRRRSCSFPGISVLLFLHEDLGKERIFQVHEQFQRPPWRYQCTQITRGQSHLYSLAQQDFYGMGEQMPLWGVRQVHRGPEILRVTLYCSFDNYEDAVRLYEMLLQKGATTQESNFCLFMLSEMRDVAVQLCLKQLPAGVAAEPRESVALEFAVREMGQLVPLLPNPCEPISSSRWQTQDYEGNTILLQVHDSSKLREVNVGLSHQHSSAGNEKLLQDSVQAPLPVTWDSPGWRSQELRARKGNTKSDQNKATGDLHRHSSFSPAARAWWDWEVCSIYSRASSKLQASLQDSHSRWPTAETNVDTGLAVASPSNSCCSLSRFPREMWRSLIQPKAPTDGASSTMSTPDRTRLLFTAARRSKGTWQKGWSFHVGRAWASPADGAEEEEEFFI